MNNNLDGFDRVWDRVISDRRGHRPPPPPPRPPKPAEPVCECETLRVFMDRAAQSAQMYRELSRRCRNRRDAAMFSEMHRDETESLRELQSSYFLITGDSYRPNTKPIRPQGMLSMIREQYRYELRTAEMYEDELRENKISNISQICKKNLAKARRHAEILEKLINNAMR